MRWLFVSLLVLQTATCGQTGPLTLPEEQAPAGRSLALSSATSASTSASTGTGH
jgi:predicted small lipoprotein YifL